MPLYVYSCPKCHAQVERFRSVDGRKDPVPCQRPGCGERMTLLTAPEPEFKPRRVADVFRKI